MHGHAGALDRRKAMRVVRRGPDRVGHVVSDLAGIDVKCRGDLDVTDVIAAEVHIHQARDRLIGVGVAIVREPLDEGAGAIADADDADADTASVLKTGMHGWPCSTGDLEVNVSTFANVSL